ncbi:nucleotidyltransferase family protein [Alicyclobacillus mali (ex Roth et al. 2021)]|uniref:nucleotidyltransferase family protein n=1 Tax=Alicyclobacillus mali (ex Roth et al. 2021) TaxID=1123961 RepID=UPI001E3EE90A|nr:nucleotidyltransferase family protein [Alicyclobacillus mali (ex Roth et al. 2021)]
MNSVREDIHYLLDVIPISDVLKTRRYYEALQKGRNIFQSECPVWTMEKLRPLKDTILEIARRHRVQNLWVFGSVARGEADEYSDVDFLAEFQEGATLLDLSGLCEELSELLGCDVHVVSKRSFSECELQDVMREARSL